MCSPNINTDISSFVTEPKHLVGLYITNLQLIHQIIKKKIGCIFYNVFKSIHLFMLSKLN